MTHRTQTTSWLARTDSFEERHIGPAPADVAVMLETLGFDSLDALVAAALPGCIRSERPLDLPAPMGEQEALLALKDIVAQNRMMRSYIGMGYHRCITPPVILRNVIENPGWYTQYTPYQAEISQGRLEMLLCFQTMIAELTGLPVANASLLDEGTAAAEAMAMCLRLRPRRSEANKFFVSQGCHPQTIEVVRGRAEAIGVEVVVGDHASLSPTGALFGCLVQYPTTDGMICDYTDLGERLHAAGARLVVAADILGLTLLRPPGEIGADIGVGSTQRFGAPMGCGGPSAAYFATRPEHARQLPGRIIGISKDADGGRALRMALQTREQHIRRDRATSNICTAQVLLAVVAGAFGVYHGPDGLRAIGERVRRLTLALREGLLRAGHGVPGGPVFDTVRVTPAGLSEPDVLERALARGINLRGMGDGTVCVALDSTVVGRDLADILGAFGAEQPDPGALLQASAEPLPAALARTSPFMTHPVFHRYHCETEMMRYLKRLENRDLSLATAMIPLGSCTMKLNAAAAMLPITWPELDIHPFAPPEQKAGYRRIFEDLETWLSEITGMEAVSLQPNAGAQGEYAGLLVIRAYHRDRGEAHRNVCLIPTSAHGTNPASAVMAGLDVVTVECDERGNIDVEDLRAKAAANAGALAALMVTYPSTHGVFEAGIRGICDVVHEHGGQVYMDGANMNALVGLCRPAELGADVLHLNLHKTFAMPHGGGGPGMAPIAVKAHLRPFLPGHPVVPGAGGEKAIRPVSAAPWGSAGVLPITWMYIRLMGGEGLTEATKVAVLNANYVARRLREEYPVVYTGPGGLVAHECIIDCRSMKTLAGIQVDDVAKRLMDYGFHAPTMSWPVPGTLMVEPTESESRAELDRLCDALLAISVEAREIAAGVADAADNVLRNAPHTASAVISDAWSHPYSREKAAFPSAATREQKFWPAVARVDNAYGDRNLVCTLQVEGDAA